jgi:hypothetical protein
MSKAPSLASINLKDRLASAAGPQPARSAPAPVQKPDSEPSPTTSKARRGKTMIAGYFTPEFARAVRMLAVEQDTSVQALIGEALDDLLRRHGKHPFGER